MATQRLDAMIFGNEPSLFPSDDLLLGPQLTRGTFASNSRSFWREMISPRPSRGVCVLSTPESLPTRSSQQPQRLARLGALAEGPGAYVQGSCSRDARMLATYLSNGSWPLHI